jgi:hypothetical protein
MSLGEMLAQCSQQWLNENQISEPIVLPHNHDASALRSIKD